MLSRLRKLLENWVARVFFTVLIGIFVFWGISNVLTLVGNNTAVAHIGGKPVDIALVQADYQTELSTAQQTNPQPDLPTRQQLAGQALASVLRQQSLALEEQKLGLAVPDSAVRAMLYGMPAFQTNGAFDKARFNQILQSNNLTPDRFIADVKDDIGNSQLVYPVVYGAGAPSVLIDQVFAFVAEQRIAETVTIPFSAEPAPATPSDAVLQRYWKNHPAAFTAPEYRTIKLVILSPALLAHTETVSDADVAAAYARATAGQQAQPLRSVQVITTQSEAGAATLAAAWTKNPDWTAIQALAKRIGGNAIELDNAKQVDFPSTDLAAAVFAAPPGQVAGPITGQLGIFVFKVLNVSSSLPSEASMQAQIKADLQLQKAQQDVAQDVDNVQDALAGQTPLDQLPGNLGLVALEGTLDATGNAQDGTPAPIPGGADLKAAIIKAVFAAHPGDPAQLINGPAGSYFALTVDAVIPPALRPYNTVQSQVAAAWTHDAITRAAEIKAAALYAAVNAGQSLDDAASAAGLSVSMTAPVTRNAPPSGVTSQMEQVLFSLKPGQATMLQTDTGFTVAALAKIVHPTPQDDPQDYAQVQSSMVKAMQNDIGQSFIAGLQARDKVTIDQKLFAQIYQ